MLWRNCLFFLLWASYASDRERHVSLCISLSSDTSWQVSPIPHLSQPHCTLSSRCTFLSQVLVPMSPAGFGQWCTASLAGVTFQSLLLLSKICGVTWRLDQSWSPPLDCHPWMYGIKKDFVEAKQSQATPCIFFLSVFPPHICYHCLFPTRMAGVYHRGHWVRGRNTPWSGHPSFTKYTNYLLIHSHLPHNLDPPINLVFEL